MATHRIEAAATTNKLVDWYPFLGIECVGRASDDRSRARIFRSGFASRRASFSSDGPMLSCMIALTGLAHGTHALRTAVRPIYARAARTLAVRASADAADGAVVAAAEPEQLRSEFLQTMRWRGFIHQSTDLGALDTAMAEGRVVAYLGFDATASSLHVGSLLQIMLLRHFQRAGHKPIVLVGGGTTKVGDPSGKDASRQLLDNEAIAANIAGISQVSCSAPQRSLEPLPYASPIS